MGNNQGWTQAQWKTDIALAQAAGIDGFVLNIATPLTSISSSISSAFAAAEAQSFKLVFSFDYAGGSGPWAKTDVISLINSYGSRAGYYKVNNAPFVSTFEGTGNAADWPSIRSAVSTGIYFVPDWTSLGPANFAANQLSKVDGAFSWDLWPAGATDMTSAPDVAWKAALGPKAFMMGVAPWFYTDLPQWNKQWVWRGDDLWHLRWQQVLAVNPSFVEIVTWNDYGESHYIGPIYDQGVPTGAGRYVDGMPHDAWRETLPYYIAAYKNGGSAPVTTEKLTYWYRLTPAAAGNPDGVVGNDKDYQQTLPAASVVQDKVFVTAIVKSAATVTVSIGGSQVGSQLCATAGACHFSVNFGGKTGAVVITMARNGQTVLSGTGKSITSQPADGITNFNAWCGSASDGTSSSSSATPTPTTYVN